MRIIHIITDYLKSTILTSKGDIIKHDGVSAKKFSVGTAYYVLRANNLGQDIEYKSSGYILQEMDTKGDLWKHDGFSSRQFSIGNAGQILRVNDVPDDLEYQDPGRAMFERVYTAKNIPDIDLAVGGVTVLDIDMGNVLLGDFFMIWGHVFGTNTGTATGIRFEMLKGAGTASIEFLYDKTELVHYGEVGNNQSCGFNLSTFMKVSGSGTLTLRIRGIGSTDIQVASNNCQLYLHQVRKPLP